MLETSARLLRLLSLLQSAPDWTGPRLAERLGVSSRTIRHDVDRLRSLGYPVHATPGTTGGYRLGAGTALPPLLLDDDEGVAVAIGLRSAAVGTVTGAEESALRALTKLEQVLPSRLRRRVKAVADAVLWLPATGSAGATGPAGPNGPAGPTVDADTLASIAAACRDRERLRFDYRDHSGEGSLRVTEPYRLAHAGRRWYLVAWDVDRADWRTFRVDRVELRTPTGPRFAVREPPDGGFSAYLTRTLAVATWQYRARVTVHAPAEVIARRMPAGVTIEPVDAETCAISVGSDSPHVLAMYLAMLDADFELVDAPELATELRLLAERLVRAAG